MLNLSPAPRVFLALAPIDGRKGFNGLYTLVKETLPFSLIAKGKIHNLKP